MTNKNELKVEMVRHNETGADLAKALGITAPTFSNKMNNISEFTQEEIFIIKNRYDLSSERVDVIFFAKEVP